MITTKEAIIALPHTHLRQRSKRIGLVSPEILDIIDSMQSATLDWEDSRKHEIGVALAAVQLGKMWRIVVIRSNFDKKEDRTFQVFLNPEITKYEGEIIEDFEGCLSIKDMYGRVPRYSKVRVKALDNNGKSIRLTAEGFLARIFQHEIDHTNGKLFIDHIKNDPSAFFQLDSDGHLIALDYESHVKNNKLLWV